VYRYDSFVPNHKQVAAGDVAVVRGKARVHGVAVIESVKATPGVKRRLRCPQCQQTKLKERQDRRPQFRCECGAVFDQPNEVTEPCA